MILLGFFLALMFLYLQMTIPVLHEVPVLAFSPFLALATLSCTMSRALLWSALSGLILDLLSSDPFGIHALGYCLATLFAFRFRQLFSLEIPLQFGFFTSIISAFLTFFQISLLFLFDRRIVFQGKWWLIDWSVLTISDALFALFWFAGPLWLYRVVRRLWGIYWLKKNQDRIYQN